MVSSPCQNLTRSIAACFCKRARTRQLKGNICAFPLGHASSQDSIDNLRKTGKRQAVFPKQHMPGSHSIIAPLHGRLILIAYSERKQPDQDQAAKKQRGQAAAEDLEAGLVLLAIVGISDPLRAEVVTAVQQCNRAGITVRMLTGQSRPPLK